MYDGLYRLLDGRSYDRINEPRARRTNAAHELMNAAIDEFQPRRVEDLVAHVENGAAEVRTAARAVIASRRQFAPSVHHAEWHMRGVCYHFARLAESYNAWASGAAGRGQTETAGGSKPDVIIMFAPEYQRMMFEFYALVNLVRISLDSLRRYLRPVFSTPFGQIPKSISAVIVSRTSGRWRRAII